MTDQEMEKSIAERVTAKLMAARRIGIDECINLAQSQGYYELAGRMEALKHEAEV